MPVTDHLMSLVLLTTLVLGSTLSQGTLRSGMCHYVCAIVDELLYKTTIISSATAEIPRVVDQSLLVYFTLLPRQ